MNRKKFLATGIAAFPAFTLLQSASAMGTATQPFVVRSGEGRSGKPMMYRGRHPNNIVISKKDTDGVMSVFAYTGYERIGPSLHMHLDQDEIFYVGEGKYRFVVGEAIHELSAGDTIFLPRKIAHSWIQLTDRGQLLYMVQPAGTMEEFFQEMDGLKMPATEEQVKAIHQKHGMKLLGPGLKLQQP